MNCQMEKDKEVPHWATDRVGAGPGGAVGLGSADREVRWGWGARPWSRAASVRRGYPSPLHFRPIFMLLLCPLIISIDKLFT